MINNIHFWVIKTELRLLLLATKTTASSLFHRVSNTQMLVPRKNMVYCVSMTELTITHPMFIPESTPTRLP